MTFALRSSRVVLPDGVRPAAVLVRDGRIADVVAGGRLPEGVDVHDVGDDVIGPGLVDSHVHVNEPGRTAWEGYRTATRAAAAGGVTTIVDMPLNSLPPTTTVAALRLKRAAAQGQLWVDVALWGGITSADVSAVAPLVDEGVCGFKVFLADSGVPEFPPVDGPGLLAALGAAGRRAVPVVVHAESPAVLAGAPGPVGRGAASWAASRPAEAEVDALRTVIAAARATGAHAHVLHMSAADALPLLEQTRREGDVRLTVETCPHYLSLVLEELPDGQTTAKCAPPIRDEANQAALWDGVRAGLVDQVVSDHSPSPPELKTDDFATSWGGIAGLQTQLPAVWTAARSHGVGLAELSRLQSTAPALLAGLRGKGEIRTGYDADLVVWDPEASFVVEPAALLHRHALSPWAGRRLHGVVRSTWLRGARVDVDGDPTGRLLERAL